MNGELLDNRFRSISYNIHAGGGVDWGYLPQEERLPRIYSTINAVTQDFGLVAVFLCEVSSEKNFELIASETDLEVVTQPYRLNGCETIGFLADKETARCSASKLITTSDSTHGGSFAAMEMEDEDLVIIGGHPSNKLIEHHESRKSMFHGMIEHGAKFKQTIIEGDFNTPPLFPARQLLKRHGYKSAFNMLEARFPTKGNRRHLRYPLFPSMQIDGMYVKNLEVDNSSEVRARDSDHPMLIADCKLN